MMEFRNRQIEVTLVLSEMDFEFERNTCKLKPNTMKRIKSVNNRNYDRFLTAEQFRMLELDLNY